MRIRVICDDSTSLLNKIVKKISGKELETWEIKRNDKSEILFSHIPEQWKEKAMPKPYIKQNSLDFVISWWSKNAEPEKRIQGYILGRFIEILMVHFRKDFKNIEIE